MTHDLILTYYGDDFTGSTDVMEVLTWAGLPTVLFVEPPDDERLSRFPNVRAVGLAGESRGRPPEWMDENLPAVFERLKALGAPLCHYKVCSTFDSSPRVGSIGRALDIGLRTFGCRWVPIVVGAPKLNRYQAFGNLFATVGEQTYRLDRHPTMSRHPVTPMEESDLRRHLVRQTSRRTGLVDLSALTNGSGAQRLADQLEGGAEAVLFDVIDDATLTEAGRLIWENRADASFSVSSSGLQYALTAYWRAAGDLPIERPAPPAPEVDLVAIVSGSCSPETEASIRWALENGYRGVRVGAPEIASGDVDRAVTAAISAANDGKSFIVYTALGPDDAAIGAADADFQEKLGEHLGRVMRRVLETTGIRRAVVCGGDTSSRVGRQLKIYALTAVAPLTPGSPLCRAHADGPLDGLEIVMKGGQRGGPPFFEEVRKGRLGDG